MNNLYHSYTNQNMISPVIMFFPMSLAILLSISYINCQSSPVSYAPTPSPVQPNPIHLTPSPAQWSVSPVPAHDPPADPIAGPSPTPQYHLGPTPIPCPPMSDPIPPSYPPESQPSLPSNPDPAYKGIRAAYWPSESALEPSFIDTTYFTHIYYAFLLPDPANSTVNVTQFDEQRIPQFINALHARNPPVKTLVSIGGASVNPADFSKIASTKQSRYIFIDSAIEVARKYGFDGIDLDWEYPVDDKEMSWLGTFYKEFKRAIVHEAEKSGKRRLLLTSAVYYSSTKLFDVPRTYPIGAINKYVDWISPMCYDYHGPWENFTGPNSALYEPNTNFSTSFGIGSWIQAGVPPEKIVMGLPLYGHTWMLQNPDVNGIGAPAAGMGPAQGWLTYDDILAFNIKNNAVVHYDGGYVTYYSYAGGVWIGYDDTMSVVLKIQFAKSKALGGYFFWALGQDMNGTISKLASDEWEQ